MLSDPFKEKHIFLCLFKINICGFPVMSHSSKNITRWTLPNPGNFNSDFYSDLNGKASIWKTSTVMCIFLTLFYFLSLFFEDHYSWYNEGKCSTVFPHLCDDYHGILDVNLSCWLLKRFWLIVFNVKNSGG